MLLSKERFINEVSRVGPLTRRRALLLIPKAITFGKFPARERLHVFCLVHHQAVRNVELELSRNSGTGALQSKAGKNPFMQNRMIYVGRMRFSHQNSRKNTENCSFASYVWEMCGKVHTLSLRFILKFKNLAAGAGGQARRSRNRCPTVESREQ